MTADKVTLRMNALVNYRVINAPKSVMVTDGTKQSLYREAELAVRGGWHPRFGLVPDGQGCRGQ